MLGRMYYKVIDNIPLKLFYMFFGILDLHSHIRYNQIKKIVNGEKETVDIGSGIGLMTYEFAKGTKNNYYQIIYDDNDAKLNKKIKEVYDFNNVHLIRGRLPYVPLSSKSFEQVLLLDVLEHVQDDKTSLEEINRILCDDGELIISVPTRNYSKYFGIEFHREIGHVREGYELDEIENLFRGTNFNVIKYGYYTNRFTSLLCLIWYKHKFRGKSLIFPILYLLSLMDKLKPKNQNSCSLLIKAEKRRC